MDDPTPAVGLNRAVGLSNRRFPRSKPILCFKLFSGDQFSQKSKDHNGYIHRRSYPVRHYFFSDKYLNEI
jgi:hypothetical protein